MNKSAQITTVAVITAVITASFWLSRTYINLRQVGETLPLEALETVSYTVAYITSPLALICIALIGTFFAIEEHHVYAWLQIVAALVIVVGISWILKEAAQVPRPSGDLVARGFSQYSFPSTHAASAAVAGLLIGYHTQRLARTSKHVVCALAGSGILLVGLSRVVLAVHTISDVLAGITLGSGIGLIAIIVWPNWYRLLDRLNERLQLTN